VLNDEPLDAAQLNVRESQVTRQRYRGQPELRRVVVTVYVYVGRLVQVVADEVEAIRTNSKNCGHRSTRTGDRAVHDLTIGRALGTRLCVESWTPACDRAV
jgi:hypothetical protein